MNEENLKDHKLLEIEVRKAYLELRSFLKVSKRLDIKIWKVRKIAKKLGIVRTDGNGLQYTLESKGICPKEFAQSYVELEDFKKVAKKYNLGVNRTRKILRELGALNPPGWRLKSENRNFVNPNLGKPLSEEQKKKLSECMKKRTGERNPNYKHGKNIRRPRDYKYHIITNLRKDVFNRDNYTCCYCNTRGGHLHAHHTVPFWVEPKGFEDKDNMVTVCSDCHFTKAHKGNWHYFDIDLISEKTLIKYSLDRERLNGLSVYKYKNNASDSLDSSHI